MTEKNKNLDYYLSLPYTILLIPDVETGDGGWFAEIPELPGCMTFGDSQTEVLEMIQEAKHLWLEYNLEKGNVIPEPKQQLLAETTKSI